MSEENLEQTEQETRDEVFAEIFEEEDHSVARPKVEEKEVPEEVVTEQAPQEEELTPALQAKFDGLKVELDEKEYRLKQFESRMGSLQNKYSEAVKIADRMKDAPTKEQIEEALQSQKKWEEMVEDFPSMSVVDERFNNTEESLRGEIASLKSEIDGYAEKTASAASETKNNQMTEDVLTLRKYYPNHLETYKSDAFKKWKDIQPPHVQYMCESDNLTDALRVMYRFHESVKETKKPSAQDIRNKRLAQAIETPKGRDIQRSSKTDEELTEAELRERIFNEEYSKE